MQRRFHQLDVFSATPLQGNPLAVVHAAQEKIAAGASLVQVYSGLIYAGPKLVHEICNTLG